MATILELTNLVEKFIIERDWQRFHNPKNEAVNILVEATELAERFAEEEWGSLDPIADELADVLCGILLFANFNQYDLAQLVGQVLQDRLLNNQTAQFAEFELKIWKSRAVLDLECEGSSERMILLVREAGKLVDLFIWCTDQQSYEIVQKKRDYIAQRLLRMVGHLVILSYLIGLDLAEELQRKLQVNAKKYPVGLASGDGYAALKDACRG